MEEKPKPKLLVRESLLQVARNSVGSKVFRNLFIEENGVRRDALEDGVLSCAVFVSWLLLPLRLINAAHATVESTVKDLEEFGWQSVEVSALQPGDVLVWGASPESDDHSHIGFYIGDGQAISNNSVDRTPSMHHFEYDGRRPVEKALHYDLDSHNPRKSKE